MTVSRSLLPVMPRSRAPETALSAMARTLGESPSAPCARTAGTAVVLAGLAKAAAEAARLRRRAKQKTWARFLKPETLEEGDQVSFTRSRPPGISVTRVACAGRVGHGYCKTRPSAMKFLRILLLLSPPVQPPSPSDAVFI